MSPSAQASPDNIELALIFDALRRGLKKVILISLLLAGLTYFVLTTIAPVFQSETELAIVAKSAVDRFNDPGRQAPPDSLTARMDREAINTHVRSMQSGELLLSIAEELKLAERREFNAALGPVDTFESSLRTIGLGGPRAGESERDRVLSALRERIEVYAAKESRFIGIRAQSIDPELAAQIANTLAEKYRQLLASQGVTEIGDQQNVLTAKIKGLSDEVLKLETELDRYRGEINIFKGGAQNTELNAQQLSELTAELTKAKTARGEAEARASSAHEMMKAGTADALPDVQKSPLIQNLVQQRVSIERQISELSATLLPGHPRMRQLNADLAGLKVQLRNEVSKLVSSLEKEARVARRREQSIQESLAELKSSVVSKAPQEAKLRQLEANARAKRNELANLQAQLEANRKKLDTRAQPVEAEIISKAQPASVPVFPKKGSMSALMFVACMLIGTAWIVMKALFNGARTTASIPLEPAADLHSVQRLEHVPAGVRQYDDSEVLPIARAKNKPLTVATCDAPEPLRSLDDLRSRVELSRPKEGGHRIIIAGANQDIDASSEAIELNKKLAGEGRHVILIDWCPLLDGLAEKLDMPRAPGMNELLLGKSSFEDVVVRMPGSEAHFIASGAALPEDSPDIDPDQLNLVLDALDEAYDHIVVTGNHDDARSLFEAIQGRFDAAIVVDSKSRRSSVIRDPLHTFLGFEVTELDVINFEAETAVRSSGLQRILRTSKAKSDDRPTLN